MCQLLAITRSVFPVIATIMIPFCASVTAMIAVPLAKPPVGLMMTNRASHTCADETMVPHHMAGSAANNGTFDASRSLGGAE